jgi:energy-coupling factor transport system ATP-binding protein
MGDSMRNIIDMQHAVYRYAAHIPEMPAVTAVSDMTLHVPQGAFWVVLGRNGSGKSTLSRLMNALLMPAEGTVVVDGMTTTDEAHLWQVRKTVGVVFQNPDNQIVATTVEEDVAFGPENLGIPQAEIRQRVDVSLEMVNMTEYLHHSPHMLSGGQKQRIAIAGILAMQPKCIVLDEATSMLDPEGRQEVLQAIHELHAGHGMTVILITHHMEEAIQADHVLVMQAGAVLCQGTPGEVFAQADLVRAAGLDVPQTTAFGEALIQAGLYNGPLPVTEAQARQMLDEVVAAQKLAEGVAATSLEAENIAWDRAEYAAADRIEDFAGNPSTAEETPPLIRIRDLRHVYMPGTLYEKTAIDGVSLDIHKGEILGIIGHTGSGKSTLVQHLNGLLKGTSGSIEVEGVKLEPKTLKSLRRRVGLIFQYPEHQLFEETVRKDIAFGLTQQSLPAGEVDRRVDKAAALLSIAPELMEKSPFELSGGQKRRVAIAGVLAMEPSILILDEPTAGLDPRGSHEMFALLRGLNQSEGTTIVLISHNMEDMAAFADRVLVLKTGRVALLDTPRRIFSRGDALRDMHLDVPAITRLMQACAQRSGIALPTVLTVAEAVQALAPHSLKGVEA